MYTPQSLAGGALETSLGAVGRAIDNARVTGAVGTRELDSAAGCLAEATRLAGAGGPLEGGRICGLLIHAYKQATVVPKAQGNCR